jgi:nitrous oxidase accessory protein
MKATLSSFIILCLIFTLFLPGLKISARASSSIIYVPTDFPTIQEAINAARDGDTIFVYNGTYYENVVVNKTVSLIGESQENTFIRAGNASINIIDVTSDNVNVSGFHVNGANGSLPMACGFYLRGVSNVSLLHSYVTNNTIGICVETSNTCTISNNTVFSNYFGIDLRVGNTYNTIAGNNASSNGYYGIILWSGSYYNVIVQNTFMNNPHGVTLGYSDNNTIAYNDILENDMGVEIQRTSNNNTFHHNNFVGNTEQADGSYINESTNTWDDGYPSGGNYWDDFITRYPDAAEIDASGLWNTSYIIDANNTDHYPLMNQSIIPESPSLLVLPLFMITTLLAVIVYKRKHSY